MEIRDAREEDGEDTRELSQRSWIEGFKHLLTGKEIENSQNSDLFYSEERFQEDKDNEEMVKLVAEEDGKVVGKIKVYWSEDETGDWIKENEAELRGMYVHPDYWRQGIGSTLIEAALEHIPDDITALKVEAFKKDERSVEFYRKNGFEIFEERTVGPDEIDMLEENKETVLMSKNL